MSEPASLYVIDRNPVCQCDGSGWYRSVDAIGREVFRPCTACSLAGWESRVGSRRASHSWQTWVERPELREAAAELRGWWGDPWCIAMHAAPGAGNYGTGKTHAAIAVGREWVLAGRLPVAYYHVPALIQRFRDAIGDEHLEPPHAADLDGMVILDDLGAEAATPYAAEIADRIVDQRYGAGLPTVITTNLSTEQLDRRYPRATDRMHEGRLVEWSATSYRRR